MNGIFCEHMLSNFWIYNRLLYLISIPCLPLMIVTSSECQFQWYMTMDSAVLNVNCGALVLIVLSILQSLSAYDSYDFALMEVQVDENFTRKTAQLVISTATLFDYRLKIELQLASPERPSADGIFRTPTEYVELYAIAKHTLHIMEIGNDAMQR
jgi:hypothetical protein